MAPTVLATTLLIILSCSHLLQTSAQSTTNQTATKEDEGATQTTTTSPQNTTVTTTIGHNTTEATTTSPHNATETTPTTPHNATETTPTTPHKATETTAAGVNATDSSRTTVQSTATTQTATTSVYIQMRITNMDFTTFLTDSNSEQFKTLEASIKQMFNDVYNCSSCSTNKTYAGVNILTFSPGSVITNTRAEFTGPQTPEEAKTILDTALSRNGNAINGLQISDVKASSTPIPTSNSSATVPGWGIALLVLVAIILLVAIIFLIILSIMLCRRSSRGYMDVFATRGSYHSMNDYTSYQTHGRYVAPAKHESSGNGTKNQYSYTNQGLETNNL